MEQAGILTDNMKNFPAVIASQKRVHLKGLCRMSSSLDGQEESACQSNATPDVNPKDVRWPRMSREVQLVGSGWTEVCRGREAGDKAESMGWSHSWKNHQGIWAFSEGKWEPLKVVAGEQPNHHHLLGQAFWLQKGKWT